MSEQDFKDIMMDKFTVGNEDEMNALTTTGAVLRMGIKIGQQLT